MTTTEITATDMGTSGDRLVLPDGRVLGYAIYGDEDGTPLPFLSGTPSSRVMGETFGERVEITYLHATDRDTTSQNE